MKKSTYQLETLVCPSCSEKIGAMLKMTPGIRESEVLFNSSRVRVTYDETTIDSAAIKGKIKKLGYRVLSEK
jgi:copper chaperone